jgi:hypothetical protein
MTLFQKCTRLEAGTHTRTWNEVSVRTISLIGEIGDNLLQELRLAGTGITHNTHVDIASKMDTLLSLFVHTTHQLQ